MAAVKGEELVPGSASPGRQPAPSVGEYRRRSRILVSNRLLITGIVGGAFIWAVWGTGFGALTLFQGFARAAEFVVTDLLPPRLEVVPQHLDAALETLYMSYAGMVISIVLSIPLAVLAARNTTVHRAVSYLAKATTAFIRAVPEIVFGIFLVAVFGLGPVAGTIALGVGGVGILAKAYADGLEATDMRQVEGIRAAGGSWLQMLGQGVWPQFKPSFVTWSLFRLDLNIRAAAVLGLVGAGGIGHSLLQAINLYQFKTGTTLILMIFVMILIVEATTGAIRRKVL
jgi:phosphonate transport system permease protein